MRTTATLLLAIFLFACNTVKKNSRVHIETKDSTVVTEAKKETLTVSDSVYKKNSDSSWSREIEIDYDTASFSPSMSPAWDGTATTATATWGLRSRVKTVRIKERGTRSVTDSGQTVRFNASSVVKKDSVQVKGHLNTVEKQKTDKQARHYRAAVTGGDCGSGNCGIRSKKNIKTMILCAVV